MELRSLEDFDSFSGAKIALICGSKVVTYLRDNKPSISFPDHWDLAGGGREGNETPEQCALRETEEEFDLKLNIGRIVWRRRYQNVSEPSEHAYFMVAHISKAEVSTIRFGNEGQFWQLMNIQRFLKHPKAVPQLQSRLAHYLSQTS